MSNNAFGEDEDMELFDLAEAEAADAVGDIEEIEFDDEEEDLFQDEEENFYLKSGRGDSTLIVADDNMEDELEIAYGRYVKSRKVKREQELSDKELADREIHGDGDVEGRTVSAKRARKDAKSESKIARRHEEDGVSTKVLGVRVTEQEDLDAYVRMLSAEGDDSEEEEDGKYHGDRGDDDEYEFDEEEEQEDVDEVPSKRPRKMVTEEEAPAVSRAGKWFANPIFQENMTNLIEKSANTSTGERKEKKRRSKSGMSDAAVAVMDEMPLTDKEMRKEKRKKETLRQLKKQSKNNAGLEEGETVVSGFEVAPAIDDYDDDENLDEKTKRHRALISQGLGKRARQDENGAVEIVPAESGLTVHDTRSYDSDHEDYDNHDRAVTLAMGTMMLRQSKRKAIVDASYNRYSWNDPENLPSWFMDDETRHNKPQLPVPAALLEQLKSKFQTTGTKDIKKVAEARMRKRKRAANQLKAAKKQANAVADNGDMSDKQKIKVSTPLIVRLPIESVIDLIGYIRRLHGR
jgi:AdoMet-dependent rRNA methyltransferase SPB1